MDMRYRQGRMGAFFQLKLTYTRISDTIGFNGQEAPVTRQRYAYLHILCLSDEHFRGRIISTERLETEEVK